VASFANCFLVLIYSPQERSLRQHLNKALSVARSLPEEALNSSGRERLPNVSLSSGGVRSPFSGHGVASANTDSPNTASSNPRHYHATFLSSKDMERPNAAARCHKEISFFAAIVCHHTAFTHNLDRPGTSAGSSRVGTSGGSAANSRSQHGRNTSGL
jgi:hypothetical protein